MRILVFGAGAVGGYFGGRLAEAGHEVTLVARPAAAAAITASGLTILEPAATSPLRQQVTVRPVAVASLAEAVYAGELTGMMVSGQGPNGGLGGYDLILLAIKAYDVEAAAAEVAMALPAVPPIITLQNGIGTEEPLIKRFGRQRIIAGSVTTPLRQENPHTIVVERSDRGLALAAVEAGQPIEQWLSLFQAAGLDTRSCRDYQAMKYSKVMLNIIGNATAAILDQHPRAIYGSAATFDLEIAMLRETLAVMRRLKLKTVNMPGAPAALLALALTRLPQAAYKPILTRMVAGGRGHKMPSFHADLAAGKPKSEVVYHNGAIARAGRALGLPTPVNAALNDILLKLVRGEEAWDTYRARPERLLDEVARYRREVELR